MARGQIAKDAITSKILENFDGAFINVKEIRIPFVENGELVQIKCVLTCAKDNIKPGADTALPGAAAVAPKSQMGNVGSADVISVELTEDEKKNISFLAQKLKEVGM